MTTIGPQKKKTTLRRYIVALLSVFTITAAASIPLYNSIVTLKHTIRGTEKRTAELLVKNAETKNQLYERKDGARLEAIAKELGLVLEKNPRYLELTPSDELATTL